MNNKVLKTGKCITLDNGNDYLIVSSVIYEGDNYLLLMNPNNIIEQYISLVTITKDSVKLDHIDKEAKENKELIIKLNNLFKKDVERYLFNKTEEEI